ncbi:MAG: hypothetical protein ACU4F9_06120 [Arcticibacter sp.]|jgi:hypothetical protein
MGVFYSFSPKLSKAQVETFLEGEKLDYELIQEESRFVMEIKGIDDVGYFRFYYTDSTSLVAHSSHDLAIISFLRNLKLKYGFEVESDNDEFEI